MCKVLFFYFLFFLQINYMFSVKFQNSIEITSNNNYYSAVFSATGGLFKPGGREVCSCFLLGIGTNAVFNAIKFFDRLKVINM